MTSWPGLVSPSACDCVHISATLDHRCRLDPEVADDVGKADRALDSHHAPHRGDHPLGSEHRQLSCGNLARRAYRISQLGLGGFDDEPPRFELDARRAVEQVIGQPLADRSDVRRPTSSMVLRSRVAR